MILEIVSLQGGSVDSNVASQQEDPALEPILCIVDMFIGFPQVFQFPPTLKDIGAVGWEADS